jgi:lipopolysaccharide transport system permease protein
MSLSYQMPPSSQRTAAPQRAPSPKGAPTSRHRDFFWLLVRRDLKVRYAGSTLGGLWNLIHPLMMIAIYMIIFSSIMRDRMGAGAAGARYGEMSYGVHLVAGLIPWLLFADVLMRSMTALIDNGNFLKKVSFPPIVLFTSLFFNALLIHGTAWLVFVAILFALGKAVPIAALAGGLPILILLGLCGIGLGLILSGLNVFFRDTAQFITIFMQLLFWFNPIVYPRHVVTRPDKSVDELEFYERIGRWLITLNPFERFITGSQRLFGLVDTPPNLIDWTILFGFPLLCLAAGLLLFRRMLPDVRDCL